MGNDTLKGMGDDDLYLYNQGYGHDVIEDYNQIFSRYVPPHIGDGGSNDTLRFGSGIKRNNLVWDFNGSDLIFTFNDSPSDRLTISNYISRHYRIENIEIEGSQLTANEIIGFGIWSDSAAANSLTWTNTVLRFKGLDGNDILTSGNYNDQLWGDDGNDRVNANGGDDILDGGAGNDSLSGGAGIDTLVGGAGNDTLVGGAGDDIYYGGEGDDSLNDKSLQSGQDTLDGGIGNDTLKGMSDDDTYLFNRGYGHDVIEDYTQVSSRYSAYIASGGNDTLRLGEGITRNNLRWNFDGKNLVFSLTNSPNDSLTIFNYIDSRYQIENIEVEGDNLSIEEILSSTNNQDSQGLNLLRWSQTAITFKGLDGHDTITTGDYNDRLWGNDGNDIISSGDGDDTLYGGAGDDTLDGGAGSDRLYVATNNKITLSDTQTTGDGTDTISNIEFANLYGRNGNNLIDARGANIVRAVIKGNDGHDTLRGGENNDTVLGGNGNDVLFGGNGNDVLNGNGGSDRLYVIADNDITLTNTQARGDGIDTLRNIEFANLYGGKSNNRIDARNTTKISTVIKGEGGNDNLRGGQKNDTILGGSGNDTLIGYGGNDTINGGSGSDRLYVAVDNDITLTDTQVTGDGIDSISNIEFANLYGRAGNNLIDARSATKISTTIKGYDGNDTLMGSQMNDNIQGGSGSDILYGGLGDDILTGNSGADIFVLESAAGTDTIRDWSDGIDSMSLSNSLGFGDLSITNNQAETAALIADTTNNNQLLAIINNVSAADITAEDFTDI